MDEIWEVNQKENCIGYTYSFFYHELCKLLLPNQFWGKYSPLKRYWVRQKGVM